MKTKEVMQRRQRKEVKLKESANQCKRIVKEPHMKIEGIIRKKTNEQTQRKKCKKRETKLIITKGTSQLL